MRHCLLKRLKFGSEQFKALPEVYLGYISEYQLALHKLRGSCGGCGASLDGRTRLSQGLQDVLLLRKSLAIRVMKAYIIVTSMYTFLILLVLDQRIRLSYM